jgi:NADP-dependent 3-hydroxy acid dehydrogenase YdfG
MTMKRWEGRVALVTGASSGIGRAIAKRLAERGMKVAICARRYVRLEELTNEIEEAGGIAYPIECDLRDTGSIESMFQRIRDDWGGVDVMVNNAGFGKRQTLTDADEEIWRAMLEVNVLALAICTRNAVQDMRRRGVDGHVIHISSMSAYRVPPNGGMYSATKFAVRSLTEGLRMELRELDSDIRVTALSPGFVETEFAQVFNESEEAAEELYRSYPCIQPDELADTVEHILAAPQHVQYHDVLLRPTRQPN